VCERADTSAASKMVSGDRARVAWSGEKARRCRELRGEAVVLAARAVMGARTLSAAELLLRPRPPWP
jgi:hypothetical protein